MSVILSYKRTLFGYIVFIAGITFVVFAVSTLIHFDNKYFYFFLISSGASVNSSGPQKRSPLHSACAITGNNDMIITLLNNGVELDAFDEDHRVPLHYLAQLGNTQV